MKNYGNIKTRANSSPEILQSSCLFFQLVQKVVGFYGNRMFLTLRNFRQSVFTPGQIYPHHILSSNLCKITLLLPHVLLIIHNNLLHSSLIILFVFNFFNRFACRQYAMTVPNHSTYVRPLLHLPVNIPQHPTRQTLCTVHNFSRQYLHFREAK